MIQLTIVLDGFRWARWPNAVPDKADVRAGGASSRYVVPYGVVQRFWLLNPAKAAEVREFVAQFGPLTHTQQLDHRVRLKDFQDAHKDLASGRYGFRLVPSRDGLTYRPRALVDFIALAARSNYVAPPVKTCEFPGCEQIVGKAAGRHPNQRACDAHSSAVRSRRNRELKKRYQFEFGPSWEDEWEFAGRQGHDRGAYVIDCFTEGAPEGIASPDDFEVLTDTANEVTTNE